MPGKISTCQQKLIDLLYADPFFTDRTDPANHVVKVPIVFKKQGDVESLILEKLAELGVGLIIVLRHAKRPEAATYELLLACQFALSAAYNPTVADDASPTAYDIAEKAMALINGKLNGVTPQDDSDAGRFWVDANALGPLPPTKEQAHLDIQLLLVNTTIQIS